MANNDELYTPQIFSNASEAQEMRFNDFLQLQSHTPRIYCVPNMVVNFYSTNEASTSQMTVESDQTEGDGYAPVEEMWKSVDLMPRYEEAIETVRKPSAFWIDFGSSMDANKAKRRGLPPRLGNSRPFLSISGRRPSGIPVPFRSRGIVKRYPDLPVRKRGVRPGIKIFDDSFGASRSCLRYRGDKSRLRASRCLASLNAIGTREFLEVATNSRLFLRTLNSCLRAASKVESTEYEDDVATPQDSSSFDLSSLMISSTLECDKDNDSERQISSIQPYNVEGELCDRLMALPLSETEQSLPIIAPSNTPSDFVEESLAHRMEAVNLTSPFLQ